MTTIIKLWLLQVLLVVSIILFMLFGNLLEEQIMPILKDTRGTITKTTANHVEVLSLGIKNRACTTLSVQAEVFRDGIWELGDAHFVNRDGTRLEIGNQRVPTGTSYVRQMVVSPAGEKIRLTLVARCHPLWDSRQTFLELSNTIPDNSGVAQR